MRAEVAILISGKVNFRRKQEKNGVSKDFLGHTKINMSHKRKKKINNKKGNEKL